MGFVLIRTLPGIGRLLRTATDRGVVVVCDPRVVDKPYGRTFLKACGGARLSRDMADVGSFLDEPDKWRKDKPKTKKAAQKEPVRILRGLRAR